MACSSLAPLACSVDQRQVSAIDEAEQAAPTDVRESLPPSPMNLPTTQNPAQGGAGSSGSASPAVSPASLRATASMLDFEDTEIGTAGMELHWVIGGVGGADLELPVSLESTNPSEFPVRGDCSRSAAQQSCELWIRFSPGAGGARTGRLTATAADGASVAVDLTGNAKVRLTIERRGSGSGTVTSALSTAIDCGSRCTALLDAGERIGLDARTSNGSNSFLSAWVGADCEDPSQRCPVVMDASRTVEVVFSPIVNNLVFATSAAYRPDLGSVAAYDSACNEAASAAGINAANGGAYFAGMSSSTESFRERLSAVSVQGWARLDGLPFAADVDALFNDQVLHPVRYTERGETRSFSLLTGSDVGGGLGSNCSDWTLATAAAILYGGGSTEGPYNWLISYAGGCDSDDLHVLCFGRNGTAPVSVSRAAGKAIWVSNETFAPGLTGDPDEVCRQSMPAGASGARAFLATTSRSGASVLDPTVLYVRPDGQAVGTGEELGSGTLRTGIWQKGNGAYLAFAQGGIWTGQFERSLPGTSGQTCDDWGASTGYGVRGFGSSASSQFWGASMQNCDTPQFLYCIEP